MTTEKCNCGSLVDRKFCPSCGIEHDTQPELVFYEDQMYENPDMKKRLVHNSPNFLGENGSKMSIKDVNSLEDRAKWWRLNRLQNQISWKANKVNNNKVDKQNFAFLSSFHSIVDDRLFSISKEVLVEMTKMKKNKEISSISRKTVRGVNKVFIASLLMVIDERVNIEPIYKDQIVECLLKEAELTRLSRKINMYNREIVKFLGNRFERPAREKFAFFLQKNKIFNFKKQIISYAEAVSKKFTRYSMIPEFLVVACAKIVYKWNGMEIPVLTEMIKFPDGSEEERIVQTSGTVKKYASIAANLSGFVLGEAKPMTVLESRSLSLIDYQGQKIVQKQVMKTDLSLRSSCIQGCIKDLLSFSSDDFVLIDGRNGNRWNAHFVGNKLVGTSAFLRSHPDISEGMYFLFKKSGNGIVIDYTKRKQDISSIVQEYIKRPGFIVMKNNDFYTFLKNDEVESELDFVSTLDDQRLLKLRGAILGKEGTDDQEIMKHVTNMGKDARAVILNKIEARVSS